MNTLPEVIEDIIYKYKHQLEFKDVMDELRCIAWLAECDSGSDCEWSDVSYDTDSDSEYPVTTR
jgi:hypothetical protein